jgi:hypothetical protein
MASGYPPATFRIGHSRVAGAQGRHKAVIRGIAAAALLAIVAATPAVGQGALPDPARTPGALNPDVRQDTIGSTICVRGWTQTIRPQQRYTSALKRQQLRDYGYPDRRVGDYEEDHLVPLVLGRPLRSA